MPQIEESVQQRTMEQIVDVTASQIHEQVQQSTVEQIVDILVSQSVDEIVGVIMLTPQART